MESVKYPVDYFNAPEELECLICDCKEGKVIGTDCDGREAEDDCLCGCHVTAEDARIMAEDRAYERTREGA